jgi:hypothetical protein
MDNETERINRVYCGNRDLLLNFVEQDPIKTAFADHGEVGVYRAVALSHYNRDELAIALATTIAVLAARIHGNIDELEELMK